jgi:hypothetical protein
MHYFSYPKVTEIRHVRAAAAEPPPAAAASQPRIQRELVRDSLLRNPGTSRGAKR